MLVGLGRQRKASEMLQEARDAFMFSLVEEVGSKMFKVIKEYADKVLDRVDVKMIIPIRYTASQKLRAELKEAGIEPPYPNGYILYLNDGRAVEAGIIKRLEYTMMRCQWGILPYKVNDYVTTEVLHIGSHSKEYIREVTERLNSVGNGWYSDVAEVLHKIRQDLLEGKIRY